MRFENGLPEFCFAINEGNGDEVVLIKRGESGYYRYNGGAFKGQEHADWLNQRIGVTKAQAEAMKVGSLFGWHVPGARPEIYDENGLLLPPKKKYTKAREASYSEGMRDEHY